MRSGEERGSGGGPAKARLAPQGAECATNLPPPPVLPGGGSRQARRAPRRVAPRSARASRTGAASRSPDGETPGRGGSRWLRSDQANISTEAATPASVTATPATGPRAPSTERTITFPAMVEISIGATRLEPQRSCSFAVIGRVLALLVARDRLVLHAVVGGELGVAQRERRGRQPEHGNHQLVTGAAPAHAPEGGRQHGRTGHRGDHLRVLERKLHLGHSALDDRQERKRLAQPRQAAQAGELGRRAPDPWLASRTRPGSGRRRERRATAQ